MPCRSQFVRYGEAGCPDNRILRGCHNAPVELASLLARVLLAGVFAISAGAKLHDRAGSRAAVQNFGVPASLAGFVAAALPVAELLCVVLILSADPGASIGAQLSILLLGSFTVAIVVNLLRGRRPDCHCFGQLAAAPTGWLTVVRNVVLLIVAAVPLAQSTDLPSVPAQLAGYPTAQRSLGFLLGGLVVAVIVLGALFRSLLRRYGDVLLRLEALESTAGGASSGTRPAPRFELPDLDGEMVRAEDILAEERPVLLVFVSPNCVMCAALLPDLASWQTVEHPVSVVVISTGSAEANRAKLHGVPALRMLLQTDREVATAYELQGTPGAFLLGVDGVIATPGAYGVDAIRQLHDSVLAAMSAGTGPPDQGQVRSARRQAEVGDPVPAVTVQTEAGHTVELGELLDEETVLLFWDSTCGYCSRITAEVLTLEAETAVFVISRNEPGEIRATGLTSGLAHDPHFHVATALGIPGTPAAVVVRGRFIASAAAVGGANVLDLLTGQSQSVHP